MIKKIYIAGPLFNLHEQKYLEDIDKVIEEDGYVCFLPHRDQTGIDKSELKGTEMKQSTKDRIFQNDLEALEDSDLTIALVTGQDIDSGTASEIGYTFANKKPVIAINANERRYRNLFVEGMISQTVNNIDELIPIIKKKMLSNNNIIIDSKSGYSGAGRGVHKKFKNRNLYESISAYGISSHRHNPEILQELKNYTKSKIHISFTPHILPMFRGILSTIYLNLKSGINENKLYSFLKKFYKNEKFVKILRNNTMISTNDVINTNFCFISICKTQNKNQFVILSAIDNLIKGGAGQAVQNMNMKINFKNDEGLK